MKTTPNSMRKVILIVVALLCSPTFAQDLKELEQRANYAFASYMGSGLYSALDSSLYVLNIPIRIDVDRWPGTRLRFSISTGFFDYSPDDLIGISLPESIGTLSVIPGIERSFFPTDRLEIIPHLDYGYAHNFSTDASARVYSFGIHGRFYPDSDPLGNVWVNKVLVAGYTTASSEFNDGYSRLLTGYDYKLPPEVNVGNGMARPTVYGLISWQHNGLDKLEAITDRASRKFNYEVGVSLFAPEPIHIFRARIQRVGFGIQHNSFGTVFRLFIGSPF